MNTPPPSRRPSSRPGRALLAGKRVLLAEDDADLRGLMADVLRGDGLEVIEVENLEQLVARIDALAQNQLSIDLIVSDVWMPGGSGLAALRRVRHLASPPKYVLITAFGDPQLHREARELGAIAVLDKPFDLDDLRTVVWNGAR